MWLDPWMWGKFWIVLSASKFLRSENGQKVGSYVTASKERGSLCVNIDFES